MSNTKDTPMDYKHEECSKALRCLYIAVDEAVAADVDNKVSAYVHELKLELQKLNDYISASEQFNATQSQSYRDTISKMKLELQKQKEEIQRFELERTEMYHKYEKQKELNAELVEALQELNSYAPDFPEYPNSLSVFDLGLQSASKNASSILEKVLKIKP